MTNPQRRDRRIRRMGYIGGQQPRVGQLDLTIAVDIAQRHQAVVGKRQGGVNTIHGHQQPVVHVHVAIGVHIAEQPLQRRHRHLHPHLRHRRHLR